MDRKSFIELNIKAGIGFCALQTAAGCALFDEPEMRVCSMDELEENTYLISRFNRKKILATLLDGEIVIFSLLCRHKKCTVAWEEEEELFVCPCHEGTYDKYGEVIDGPPPGPLYRFKHEVRDGEIWVLNQKLEL
ncbi:MAG: Rieske 2Fe-2S domain-containing protein [Bacteroidetes bacterium]|nr:Rieske 2Fe-2S domain-containing protein [Bacteroidota bacterium]